jgi:hypothetical protein
MTASSSSLERSIPTIVSRVPAWSLALGTSILGRLLFLVSINVAYIVTLDDPATACSIHVALLIGYVIAFMLLGLSSSLCRPISAALVLGAIVLGLINWAYSVDQTQILAPLSRALGYASLGFATVLVASVTRPSDIARFASQFTRVPAILVFASFPLVLLQSLAHDMSDMFLVAYYRHRTANIFVRFYRSVIDVAIAMVATALSQSEYLAQTLETFPNGSEHGPLSYRAQTSLLAPADLLLGGILAFPGIYLWTTIR